jgi:hypothetical protein
MDLMLMSNITPYSLRTKVGSEELDYTQLISLLGDYRQPRSKINKWLADGSLIRIKKGLYVFGPEYAREPYCSETLANLIYGPSAISLEYALSFYGLIPERSTEITCITPKKNKRFKTPVGLFTYRYIHPNKYAVGITQYYLDETHPILIATPEKALVDYIYFRARGAHFKSIHDMLLFLSQDMRVDNDLLLKFDVTLLRKIKEQYKLPVIDYLIKIVEKGVRYE